MRRSGAARRVPNLAMAAMSLGVLVVGWEIAGRLEVSSVFPPISEVFGAALTVWSSDRFWESVSYTANTLLVAVPLSIGSGLVVGLLMGSFRVVQSALDLWVDVFLSLPLIALIPVITLLFGVGRGASLVVVFLSMFFPIVVNTSAGIRASSTRYREMARAFGSGRLLTLRRITLPGALPLMLTGIRLSVGRGIRGVIYAEMIIGALGVGGLLQGYGQAFQIANTWALIIAIAMVGLVAMEAVRLAEDVMLRRYPQGASIDGR